MLLKTGTYKIMARDVNELGEIWHSERIEITAINGGISGSVQYDTSNEKSHFDGIADSLGFYSFTLLYDMDGSYYNYCGASLGDCIVGTWCHTSENTPGYRGTFVWKLQLIQ